MKAKFLQAMLSLVIATVVCADDKAGVDQSVGDRFGSELTGEQTMEKSGCLSCHRVDQKLIGPAFKAVAEKYRKNADAPIFLFEKVREGGEGVWGDIPMVPNGSNKITDTDLRIVIDWILGL